MNALEREEQKMKRFILDCLEGKPAGNVPKEDAPAFRACVDGGYIKGVDILPQEDGSIAVYPTELQVTEKGRDFVR